MNLLLLLLFTFVGLGVGRRRLGGFTYVIMGLLILVYVAYSYAHPQ